MRVKQKKIIIIGVVALLIVNVFSFALIYREANSFFKNVTKEEKTYQQRIEQMNLFGISKDETVNITSETAGSLAGQDYRVSLSGNIYYATTETDERSNKWVVLIHGFMMSGESMANAVGQVYLDQGYNILAPDLRGAGNSGGKTGMGYLESLDIWDWLTFLNSNYNVDEVIIHGISLGGATTLQLWGQKEQGRDLESQHVVGLVDDCGYTSMTGIIQGLLQTPEGIKELAEILELPEPNLYNLIGEKNIKTFLINFVGVGLTQSNFDSYQDSFASNRAFSNVPMLVIHGTSDTIVPYENSTIVINESAARGLKTTFWSVENAPHAFIVAGMNNQDYRNHIIEFTNSVTKNPADIPEQTTPSTGTNKTINQITSKIQEAYTNILNRIKEIFS